MSRRDFLKMLGLGSVSALLPHATPVSAAAIQNPTPLGRALNWYVHIYEEPDTLSKKVAYLVYDDIIKLPEKFQVTDKNHRVWNWYKLGDGQYIDAAWIQPVFNIRNTSSQPIPEKGCLGEVTMAIVDVFSAPRGERINRHFYYSSTFWVLERVFDEFGVPWYKLLDDFNGGHFFVRAYNIRLVPAEELTPISADVPLEEKRLELEILTQKVRAFERGKQVWEAPVSSGKEKGSTPYGVFQTNRKRPCRRMVNEPANPNVYDLPGVPWCSYITDSGVAFHGAYWHSNWGQRMSNGCINMQAEDAKWIYRWCNPTVPVDEYYYTAEIGTRVDVIPGG